MADPDTEKMAQYLLKCNFGAASKQEIKREIKRRLEEATLSMQPEGDVSDVIGTKTVDFAPDPPTGK